MTGESLSRPGAAVGRAAGIIAPRRAALQGKALEVTTQVLLVMLLPRFLGPAEFGRLTVALTIVTLASVTLSLGAPSSFARFLPAEAAARRAGLARSMTLQLLRVRSVQLVIAGGLGAALVLVVPARFPPLDTGLVFLALVAEVGAVLAAQVALGIGRTWVWSFRIAAKNAALLVAVPLLFHLLGPVGLLQSILLSSVAGLVFAGWTVLGLIWRAERGIPIPAGAARYGIVAGLALLVGQLTYRGPVLAATVLAGSAVETGFAALAGSVAMAIMLAVREVFTVSLPELVDHWGRDRGHAQGLLRRLGWWSEAALVPGSLLGVMLLGHGLPLVAGQQFTPAVGTLVPILALFPLLPLPLLGWQGAALQLRPEVALTISAAGLLAFLATAVLLVPLWGARGASAGLLAAVAASSLLTAWLLPTSVPPRLLMVGMLGSLGVLALAAMMGLAR
jgi:O-antigen/teichoic acid export membrane protein